jgi:hypothetical protein
VSGVALMDPSPLRSSHACASFGRRFLSSAFMLGRFIGSFPLGYMGDRLGRKPVLYLGLITTVIFGVVSDSLRSSWCEQVVIVLDGLQYSYLSLLGVYQMKASKIRHRDTADGGPSFVSSPGVWHGRQLDGGGGRAAVHGHVQRRCGHIQDGTDGGRWFGMH